ncbi:glycine-rich domain-containing protein [Aeromonas veronii]|uniref:glycine-rich domain-containing protein n=1 Tax=Aeromonas veronii TaxID=654 RepID=UPI003CEA5CB8
MITLGAASQRTPTYAALKSSIILFDIAPGTRTFTVPEGVSKIRAFVVGAGGSGNVATSGNYYSPGGGGGYAEKTIDVTPGQTFTYTVGDKTPYAQDQQLQGGTSSFGGLISATGGKNGYSQSVPSTQAGGVGIGGDLNADGGDGLANTVHGAGAGSRFGKGTSQSIQHDIAVGGGFARVGDGWGIGIWDCGAPANNTLMFAPRLGAGDTPHPSDPRAQPTRSSPLVGGGGSSSQSFARNGGVGAVGVEVLA